MVVNNKTKLNGEEAHKLLISSTNKELPKKIFFMAAVLVLGIAIVVISHMISNTKYLILGYVFCAVAVAYFIYVIIQLLRTPKLVYKKNQEVCDNGIEYSYVFKEQSFNVVTKLPNKNIKKDYKYDNIKKIYELNESFEFYLDDQTVFYVSKSGFDNERMIEYFIKNITMNKKKIKNLQDKKKD